MSEPQEHVVRRYEQQLSLAWNTYAQNQRHRSQRYDLIGLRFLARAATELAAAIEEHGLPPLEISPADEKDKKLARQAHSWAQCLASRADMLAAGTGSTLIETSVSRKPASVRHNRRTGQVTIRYWLKDTVKLLDSSPLQTQLDKRHAAESVLELKANLLACYDYCKRFYNSLKPRKPRETASDEAIAAYRAEAGKHKTSIRAVFERLLKAAIPFPLTNATRAIALRQLGHVLVDKGQAQHQPPSQAATEVIQEIIRKYLDKKVSAEFIRQGASFIAADARPTPEMRQALAQEQQDPDHSMRDIVRQNIERGRALEVERMQAAAEAERSPGPRAESGAGTDP